MNYIPKYALSAATAVESPPLPSSSSSDAIDTSEVPRQAVGAHIEEALDTALLSAAIDKLALVSSERDA